ncbi:MAG TPA: GIY-YIG nuclease family protein [Verrucomicrobiae bacterium]
MDKQYILEAIRRTAKTNGGKPLGRSKFSTETGIKESDWSGVYWIRWGDALIEAGFTPNQMSEAPADEWLISKLITFTRELKRFPLSAELRMKARNDPDFPGHTAFQKRFGSKNQVVSKVMEFCSNKKGYEDILLLCESTTARNESPQEKADRGIEPPDGFVYLLKSGRYHKIGRSNSTGRREYELAIQLPEKAVIVHEIRTDDPIGIEAYWHKRFELKRKNGEWFELNAAEVKAFKRRKFM